MEPIEGSIEIIRGNESIGVVGVRWHPETVPTVLESLYGLTALVEVEPVTAQTGRVPVCQWRGVDRENQGIDVMLWEAIPFDETMIGQAIAASLDGGAE